MGLKLLFNSLMSATVCLACSQSPISRAIPEEELKQQKQLPLPSGPDKTCDIQFTDFVCAKIKWVISPQVNVGCQFLLTAIDARSKQPIRFDHPFRVKLWMPSMGHGSAPVKLNQISETEIEVSNIWFIMEGDWEIQFIQNDKIVYKISLILP